MGLIQSSFNYFNTFLILKQCSNFLNDEILSAMDIKLNCFLSMKQNDCPPSSYENKMIHTERYKRQKNSNERPIYSPRLITRRNQRSPIPVNAFARRKTSPQQSGLLRYLSQKKKSPEKPLTFLNDQNVDKLPYSQCGQLTLDLTFTNIGKQTQRNDETLYCSQDLFGNIRCNRKMSAESCLNSLRMEKRQNDLSYMEDETGLSLDTMSQSPQLAQSRKLQEKFMVLLRQNKGLAKEKETMQKKNKILRQQNQGIKQRSQQIQIKLKYKVIQLEKMDKIFEQKLQKLSEELNSKIQTLERDLNLQQNKIEQMEAQKLDNERKVSTYEQKIEILQNQCFQKQHYLQSLHLEVESIKWQMSEKCQYSNCLEDVILQLNQKIDILRQQNNEANCLLNQNSQQIRQYLTEKKHNINTICFYETELEQYRQKIVELDRNYHQLSVKQQCRQYSHDNAILVQNYSIQSAKQEIPSLREEISSLRQLINFQKEQNEQLRKQISYKELQLTFNKKNNYQHGKQRKQIQMLRERNKKLMKKLDQLMEENAQLKEKNQEFKRNLKKANPTKKLNGFLSANDQILFDKKTPHADKGLPLSNRTNIHQAQFIGANKNQTHHRNKHCGGESDDELSFKFSPEKA